MGPVEKTLTAVCARRSACRACRACRTVLSAARPATPTPDTPTKPTAKDTKTVWVAYAVARGMPRAEAEESTKAQLMTEMG